MEPEVIYNLLSAIKGLTNAADDEFLLKMIELINNKSLA